MSVMRLERSTIERIASTITILDNEQVRKLILESETDYMKMRREYRNEGESDDQLFEHCICNLFHYANIGNALAYSMQYNEQPDCFPLKFSTIGKSDLPEPDSLRKAIDERLIYPTINAAQDELRHLRYNLITNDGNSFMPEGLYQLISDLTDLLIKIAPHIQTEEELATDRAYARAYSD